MEMQQLSYNHFDTEEAALEALPSLENPAELIDTLAFLVEKRFSRVALAKKLGYQDAADVRHLVIIARKLHPSVKTLLHRGAIKIGHARALARMPLAEQEKFAGTVVSQKLTVREVEARARGEVALDMAVLNQLAEEMSSEKGYPVNIVPDKKKPNQAGELRYRYNSLDELDHLRSALGYRVKEDWE